MARHRADRRALRRPPATAATTPYGGPGGRHADRSRGRGRVASTASRLVVAVAVATLAVAAVGAPADDGSSKAARALLVGHAVTPVGSGSASQAGSTDSLWERERPVSRGFQRQALADTTRQRLRPATLAHRKQPKAAPAGPARAEKHTRPLTRHRWQLPVTKGAYHLTARFGSCTGLWAHCHTGLDFAAPSGTAIHAVANGTITQTTWAGAYGNRTIERLPDGTELWYAHQLAFGVKPGQKVVAGQRIGLVGSTGNTTGPHVHLEVRPRRDDPVDPYHALVAHGLHP